MNRRSFLLGLATVPVAGVAAITAAPVVGFDGGAADDVYWVVRKINGIVVWEEFHVLGGNGAALNRFRDEIALIIPDAFLKIQTAIK